MIFGYGGWPSAILVIAYGILAAGGVLLAMGYILAMVLCIAVAFGMIVVATKKEHNDDL